MSDKNKSYCTNESFWNELDPQLKKVYKLLSKQANKQSNNKKENKKSSSNKKSPLTKQAIAQLIQQGQYAQDYHNAVIYSFSIETKQLTKAERKIAKICFKISHSKYMAQLYQMVLINEKAHASLKVIAEIKGLINSGSSSNNDQSNTQPTNLSINLSQEPTKKPPEEETNNNKDKDNLSNSPPLDLMLN